jgi:lipopolysaccharide/colanic/teichoic acid biosynthesis glycosyltransferase
VRFYLLFKRIFDISVSSMAIVSLSPIFLVVSLLIWIQDGRPVIFRQERVGIKDSRFTIWKFRTMKVTPNPSKSQDYLWENGIPDNFVFKSSSNPNVTKLGRFLRKYSIDELPQFFNVLKGDMSIIGPRPEIPEIAKHYNEREIRRLFVKPGITGYAQINGRSDILHENTIFYDLYYVDHCSINLDFRIFFKTINLVIFSKGAY